MMNQRSVVTCLTIVCLALFVSFAVARGPKNQGAQQRGAGGANNANPQAAGAANGNAQRGNGMDQNRMQQQNMPTIEQLAQALLAQYDADGSNALDQAELQTALAGLRQMMMQNQAAAGGQQQMGAMMPQNQNGMPPAGRGPGRPGGGQGGQAGRGGR
ncbi:hypothetical protein Pan97_30680 [Bremerella volcania]|uniref:EF-hand domain-containing protein n=1 Tax=Bremerella volcania TaxID=2527984 RepID=A0A518C9W7_9BACT|nr:hypothetical protein [Bremerella volcania]QDU76023.1 hypothetical protein Pan97_30680 [Bremerella volcania]